MGDYVPGFATLAELMDTYQLTLTKDSQGGNVELKVHKSEAIAACNASIGLGHPQSLLLKVTQANLKPFGGDHVQVGQQIEYEYYVLTLTYSAEKEEPETEDLVSENLEPTAEFAKMDHRRFRWNSVAGDPLEESEAPGRLVHGLRLNRTLHNRATVPASALTLGGKVNSASYTSALLGLTFPAETLLFIPPKLSRTLKTDGTRAWTIAVAFDYKTDGWNKFWRAKAQEYQEILDVDSGIPYKNYPTASFSDWLF